MSADKIIVIGHKSPDTDSICSALGYAAYKQALGVNAEAGMTAEPNKETMFALEKFGVVTPELVTSVPAKQKLILVDHNEEGQAVDGMRDAEIVEIIDHHRLGGISTDMVPLAQEAGLVRKLLANEWTHAIFFNLSDANADSIVQNVNFRKAIRAAIDCEEAMIAALNGDEERILLEPSPISTNNTKYYNEILKDPEVYNVNNLELAKQYLDASGYDGEEITYLCSQGTAFYRIAMVVIPRLEQIGINVNLQVVDGGSHGGLRSDPTAGYDIGAWETQKAVSNPLESGSLILGSSAGWWENEKKSELIKVMQTTLTGSDASVQAYNEFCELVKEEVPYIVFGTALSQTYIQPNVEIDYVGTYSYYWNSYFTD